MKDIHDWRLCEELLAKYHLYYKLYKECIIIYNKRDVVLGKFVSVGELINYLYGYGSGVMDAHLYKEEDDE